MYTLVVSIPAPPQLYLAAMIKSGSLLYKFWEWPGKEVSTRKPSKSGTGSNIYEDISQYFIIAELVKVIPAKI